MTLSKKTTIGVFCYDFYPLVGGQGRHVYEIYKQNQKNKKVKMIFFSPNRNDLEDHISLFESTKKSKLKNIEFSLRINAQIDSIIGKYNLDIVHFHGGPGGLFLLRRLKLPVVFTCHHTYWQQSNYINEQSWKKLFFFLEKASYKKANKIICVSEDTKKVLVDYYDLDEKKLLYIPNGIYLKTINRSAIMAKSKEILYVGRIGGRKGVDFLVRTMKIVNAKDKGILLHIVGTGKSEKALKEFSKQNNLSIKFHGFLSDQDIEKIYKNVAIQVVPSVFEGFGISVLEGMAKGVPIVATDVDGIRGIVKNNYNGILVQYGDEKALASSIINLLNDNKLQNKLFNNSLNELKKYNWNEIYHRTVKVYENLLS